MVEIAKALPVDAEIIVMDEPTASLTDKEVETLFKTMLGFLSAMSGIVLCARMFSGQPM